jgi:hypothetical protein
MWRLYGVKPGQERRLVATFDTEQQLLAYVGWATLRRHADGAYDFEQKTPLTGYRGFEYDFAAERDGQNLPHNPSPSML